MAEDTAPGKAKWVVNIDHVHPKLCSETGFTWHIHAIGLVDPVGHGFSAAAPAGATECVAAGGHYDPSLACGGASQYSKTTCTALSYGTDYGSRCGTDMQDGC